MSKNLPNRFISIPFEPYPGHRAYTQLHYIQGVPKKTPHAFFRSNFRKYQPISKILFTLKIIKFASEKTLFHENRSIGSKDIRLQSENCDFASEHDGFSSIFLFFHRS